MMTTRSRPRMNRVVALAAWIAVSAFPVAAAAQTAAPMSLFPADQPAGPSPLALQGMEIIERTSTLIGPNAKDPAKRFAGNNLACTNCHLQGGTQRLALPLYGLKDLFPHYSAKADDIITLEERVNACLTRSLNGRAMPEDAPEMKALVAYLDYLAQGMSGARVPPDMGTGHMAWMKRPADPKRGAPIYANQCALCHGSKGEGVKWSPALRDPGYMIPPLWGKDSFNDGAGLNRLITLANFLHSNMPHSSDYWTPVLRVEEAWDVAAYVISQPRPKKADLQKDYPDPLLKPVDAPYGPYADEFMEEEHKYGPFGPIARRISELKIEARLNARRKELEAQQRENAPQVLAPQRGGPGNPDLPEPLPQ